MTTSGEMWLVFGLGCAFANSSMYLSKLQLFQVKLLFIYIIFP